MDTRAINNRMVRIIRTCIIIRRICINRTRRIVRNVGSVSSASCISNNRMKRIIISVCMCAIFVLSVVLLVSIYQPGSQCA